MSVEQMGGFIQLAKCLLCEFCCMSATKEPVQPYTVPYLWTLIAILKCNPFYSHPIVSTRHMSFPRATGHIYILFGGNLYKVLKVVWKVINLHLLCEFLHLL